MHHEIKIDEAPYNAVIAGKKTFEIRYNDREYQTGDTVEMKVVGRALPEIHATIGYVTGFQQKENFVVFSLINVTTKQEVDG